MTVHSVFFDERNIRKIPFSAVPSKPQIFHLQTLCQPVISALEIVDLIQRNEESVDVTHIGEANFILTYETQKHAHQFYSWLKTIFVSLVTFFGGAFSIMTFNTDVDTAGLFTKVYEQITGRVSNGKTILELSYSIGIGLGVVFFFNHFGGRKITEDPTPMEVEMRVYEDDVNKTPLSADGFAAILSIMPPILFIRIL